MPMSRKARFEVGQIVYGQGTWAVRVVADHGDSISYVALEGYGPEDNKGRTFTAAKDLFHLQREPRRKVVADVP